MAESTSRTDLASDFVSAETAGSVAYVTLSRPEKANALNLSGSGLSVPEAADFEAYDGVTPPDQPGAVIGYHVPVQAA
jgi:hypothetical protein